MDLNSLTKHYSNGEITVVWKPGLCAHSTICWKEATGLPTVFNPRLKPWINMESSDSEKVRLQVIKCPSGALTYFVNNEKNTDNAS